MTFVHGKRYVSCAVSSLAVFLFAGGCNSQSGTASTDATPPDTTVGAPKTMPSDVPPAVSKSIEASQAQGAAMREKAASDGAASAAAQGKGR